MSDDTVWTSTRHLAVSCYTSDMNANNDGVAAQHRDEARQDATGPDYDYSLTIEETADRYAR